jgi:hypothetical protein
MMQDSGCRDEDVGRKTGNWKLGIPNLPQQNDGLLHELFSAVGATIPVGFHCTLALRTGRG